MHELSVTQSLLEIALRHAAGTRAKRITNLYVVVGQLSSIVDDSVQFYWDIISEGTMAEGACLHFRRIPAEMLCQKCGKRYLLSQEQFACPDCQSTRVRLVAGNEFYLEAIDIETQKEIKA